MGKRKSREINRKVSLQDIPDVTTPDGLSMLNNELKQLVAATSAGAAEDTKRRGSGTGGSGIPSSVFNISVEDTSTIDLELVASILRAYIIPSTTDGYVLKTLGGVVLWAPDLVGGDSGSNSYNGVIDYGDWTLGVSRPGDWGTCCYYDIDHGLGSGPNTVFCVSSSRAEADENFRVMPFVQHTGANTVRVWARDYSAHDMEEFKRPDIGRVKIYYSCVTFI